MASKRNPFSIRLRTPFAIDAGGGGGGGGGGGSLGAPAAFTTSDWSVTRAGPNQARVDITTLPANFGRPLEGIQYRLNGGSWLNLAGEYAIGIGSYVVGSVTDNVAFTMELRSTSWNVFSPAGDVKNIPATAVSVTVPNQTAPWGAKTVSGGGLFRPLNSLGQPVDLTTPLPTLQSGSRGVYTETIASTTGVTGGLGFTGAAGAPAGSVWRCNLAAGGTVDITIGALEANTFHVQTIPQASTAYGLAVLGDTIRLRAGDKNLALALQSITRGTTPSGTWTGGGDLRAGNWITITRDIGHPVTIGALEVSGANLKYIRFNDLDFLADFVGNGGGGTASISAQLNIDFGFGPKFGAVTNCRFRHPRKVVGTDIAPAAALTPINMGNGGPWWIEGNVIAGGIYGFLGSVRGTDSGSIFHRNIIRRCQEDGVNFSDCNGMTYTGNLVTDKIYQHRAFNVTAVTPGNPTVITVSDTTNILVGGPEFIVLTGFTGDFAALNGTSPLAPSKTATTVNLTVNTTGLTWDGLGGVARCPTTAHGDFTQFQNSTNQNNLVIRGNVHTRGNCDGHGMPDGQNLFGNGVPARGNWLIECNILEQVLVRGISFGNLSNSTIRSNTIMRPLGLAGGGTSNVGIVQDGGGTNNIYRDNLAPNFSLASTASEDTNNFVIALNLSQTDDVPASAGNIAVTQSHFVNPPTVPDQVIDPRTAFAIKTTGGAQSGPIFAGAHYFDWDTLTYSNPR